MQNVNIDQEVENAMMAPPQQPRGIVDLLASELKARDAKARNQLNTMMAPAPDSNTIINQNEKETENNVRQEITQKMQSMAVKENQNKAQMNQALAGIAGQRANNMNRMADGGIVGYAGGGTLTPGAVPKSAIPVGNSNQPIPMLMQKYGSEKVLGYLKERKALDAKDKAIAEAGPAAGSMQVQDLKNMKEIFSEKYRDIISESMGMAGGGIVGFQDGGRIKRFQGLEGSEVKESGGLNPLSFANWALSKSIDLTVLGAQEIAALAAEFSNTEVGQNQRSVLGEVASGAAKKIIDALPIPEADPNASKFPEMDANIQRGRDERQRKAESGGIMNTLKGIFNSDEAAAARQELQQVMQGNNSAPAATAVSKFQQELIDAGNANVNDQLLAADQRGGGIASNLSPSMFERVLPGLSGLYTDEMRAADEAAENMTLAEGMGQFREDVDGVKPNFGNIMRGVSKNVGDFVDESGLAGLDYEGFARGVLPRATGVATDVASGKIDPSLGRYLGGFANDLVTGPGRLKDTILNAEFIDEMQEGYYGEEPGTRSTNEAETVADIINNAPAIQTSATYDPMKDVNAVANPSLRRAIEGAQAAPAAAGTTPADVAAPTDEEAGEVAATQLASTVASNPTPQNMSRFESEIGRLMEERESPVRAFSSFLKSFSQARGGSMGQNLAIASTAMNAADDALDKQIIALEQLRRADQISERDFILKQDQATAQKGLLTAQASYYKNYKDMQVEIAGLKEKGDVEIANRRLYQSILDLAANNRPAYLMAAKAELGAKDMFSPEVTEKANTMMKEAVQTEYREAQRFFELPDTDGSSPQEGATATNAQGEKIIFRNGNWAPV